LNPQSSILDLQSASDSMLYLKDIATIRSGYLFRERIKPDASGQYRVVQVGDVATDDGFSDSSLVRVSLPDVKRSQVLESGDVLFISRGPRKLAIAITWPIQNPTPTAHFSFVLPEESLLSKFWV